MRPLLYYLAVVVIVYSILYYVGRNSPTHNDWD